MLYKDLFSLLSFALIAAVLAAFFLFFGVAYLINRRLDVVALGKGHHLHPGSERLFWKISKWTIQAVSFIAIGFTFVALSGFTPVPLPILWALFFIAWGLFFLHKFRSLSLPTNQFIQLQNIFDEEDDFAIDDDVNLGSIARKRHSIREKMQHYIFTCKLAINNKRTPFFVGIGVVLVVTGIIIFSTSCMCVVLHPFEINTAFARRLYTPFCVPGEICNVYFTMGTLQNDFIMNFQMEDFPDSSSVYVDTQSHYNQSATGTGWLKNYRKVQANNFKMTTIDELVRHVSWADLPNLSPNTTYYLVAAYTVGDSTFTSVEYKLRTLPSSGPFSFVSGGDMSLDEPCHQLMDFAASTSPHFAMIGGDLTYDNGFPSCYYRWDEWFDQWHKRMVTPDGHYIPILASIGNHEAGGFLSSPGDDPYFSTYFPQQTGLSQTSPKARLTYHSHSISSNTIIIVLDSDIIAPIDGVQAAWLQSQLQSASNVSLKLTLYHGNLYPAVPDSGVDAVEQRGKQFWAPYFDEYNLTASFENHCHAFKRTVPIRGDKESADGVVYLGDGAWGVDPRSPAMSWYTQVVAQKQHIYHVTVDDTSIHVDAVGVDGIVFDSWQKQLN